MRLSLDLYISMHIHICISVYLSIYIHRDRYLDSYHLPMVVEVYPNCMRPAKRRATRLKGFTHVYIYTHIYMYIYIYIYIYMYINRQKIYIHI